MCLYSFFFPPGLVYPSIHPHKPTIIKPSFKSFTFFSVVAIAWSLKHSTSLERRQKWIRESSEEIYICIIFCCFKRQIKFYIFLCSNDFPVFFACEMRDILFVWRWKMRRRELSALRRKQFIRKVSLWFNKSPQKLKNVICIHSHFSSVPFFFFYVFQQKTARQKNEMKEDENINPLCEIIQLFSRNFFICAKWKLLCCSFFFMRKDKSLLRLIMKDEKFFFSLTLSLSPSLSTDFNWWKNEGKSWEISSVNLKSRLASFDFTFLCCKGFKEGFVGVAKMRHCNSAMTARHKLKNVTAL